MSGNQNRNNTLPHIQTSSKDIHQIIELLKMFGINSYDQNVPHILLEFLYRKKSFKPITYFIESISKNIDDSVNLMTSVHSKSNTTDIPVKLLQHASKQNYKEKNRLKAFNNS